LQSGHRHPPVLSRLSVAGVIAEDIFPLVPKLVGSRFRVQRLKPMDTADHMDQDPEYSTYPPVVETAQVTQSRQCPLLSGHNRNLLEIIADNLEKVCGAAFQIALFVEGDRKPQNSLVRFDFV
jgi:hypothetical protein